MTTPTSSATTPSPTMAYLHTTPVSLVATIDSGDNDATEREARQQAIRKFLARAEISKVSLLLLCLGVLLRVEYSTMIRVLWHVWLIGGTDVLFIYTKFLDFPPCAPHFPMMRKQFRSDISNTIVLLCDSHARLFVVRRFFAFYLMASAHRC
jgi:hypothetical protein